MKIPDPVKAARKKARHKRFDRCMIFGLVAAGALAWLAGATDHAESRADLAGGFAGLTIVIGLTTFLAASWLAYRRRRTHLARPQPAQPQPRPRRLRDWGYPQDGR